MILCRRPNLVIRVAAPPDLDDATYLLREMWEDEGRDPGDPASDEAYLRSALKNALASSTHELFILLANRLPDGLAIGAVVGAVQNGQGFVSGLKTLNGADTPLELPWLLMLNAARQFECRGCDKVSITRRVTQAEVPPLRRTYNAMGFAPECLVYTTTTAQAIDALLRRI